MTEENMAEMRRLLTILKRCHDLYVKASFEEGTRILKACEATIDKLVTQFGFEKTWLESAVIFGNEFVKAERENMLVKRTEIKNVVGEQIKL